MPRRLLRMAKHHLKVYDGTTDAVIGVIAALAAFEAAALVWITGVSWWGAAVGWVAFSLILFALPWFWERLFGEDEPLPADFHPWSGIPGT